MSFFRDISQGRALDRQRADDILSGRHPSLAPTPRSIGLTSARVQRTVEPPLLLRPPNITYTLPSRPNVQCSGHPSSQSQQQLTRSPVVVVIDDSDDEEDHEANRQSQSSQQARYHNEEKDAHQDQDGGVGDVKCEHTDEEISPEQQVGNDQEAQLPLPGQEFQVAQEQTLALLVLPEVNIPRNERLKTPRALLCELLPHQRVGLTWLIRQEEDSNKRGSILADGMGLGKTVEALALIVSRKFDPEHPLTCKTTLIIAPLGLLSQWQDEIRKKVRLRHGRKLSTLIFHGSSSKNMAVQQLLQYDIILCTYGKLMSEYNMYTKGPRNKCKLLSREAKFYRVILDEAHYIKNKNTQTSKAVCQIQAVHRLCMTGTPLMNNVTELYPLVRFLRIKPYDAWEKFSEDIDRPIRSWAPGMGSPAMLRLQTLVKSLVLRRTKESRLDSKRIIKLKKRIDVEVYIEFGDEQQAFYNALELRQKLKFNKFLKAGIVMQNYMRILTWILRLRQACDHPHLIRNHCIPDVCSLDAERMIRLALQLPAHVQKSIRATGQFRCPKCEDQSSNITQNPVIISPCGHYICAECYGNLMAEGPPRNGEGVVETCKFSCPNQWCASIITPDNILMHNFFVDAQQGVERHVDLSDDDEESSDGSIEVIELDSEDDTEDEDFNGDLQRDSPVQSIEQQHDGSWGLFVDPYPNEPDPFGPDDDFDDEVSAQRSDQTHVKEEPSGISDSRALRLPISPPQRACRPISRASPARYGLRAFKRAPSVPSLSESRLQLSQGRPAKGDYGNPIDVDDEEAQFSAGSRPIAAEEYPSGANKVKLEIKGEQAEVPVILNFDGPGSPALRSKRKVRNSEGYDNDSKRARFGHTQTSAARSNSGARHQMYLESEDEDDTSASPSAYQVSPVNPNGAQQHRAGSRSASRRTITNFDDGQRFPAIFPKIEEEEDVKPDVGQLGQRARDLLQRPFVSLASKRAIADNSMRAMAAYQQRVANEWVASAKTDEIMKLLRRIRREHPGDKTLIFSLWTVFLDMLEPPLRQGGFKYTVYTGGMKTDNRTAAVKTFMTNPELDVMLISLSAGSCGLNLTAANHVILTEPFWNPFVEEQAIDRTHRLGQVKEVTVYRILVKGTIEEHIVRLQDMKKSLVSAALCDSKTDSPVNKLTIEELRGLFGV